MKIRKTGPYLWLNSQTGYYCAVFTDEQGKPRRKTLRTKDKKEATRRFNAWHREWLLKFGSVSGEGKDSPSVLVADFCEEWAAHIKNRYANSTAVQYRATASKLSEHLGNINVRAITIRVIERFIDALIKDGLSIPTINKHRRHLRIMLHDAEEWGYIDRVPRIPKPLAEKERVKHFTTEQLDMIFESIEDEEFRDFCLLALLSALRSGELLRLTAGDVDNPDGFLRISEVQKNRTESRIPITSAIRPIVEKYSTIRPSGRLFHYKSPDDISRRFKVVMDRLGIKDRTFHGLRHSYGVAMVSKGVDVMAVKDLMRHKSIASTMVYAKVAPAHLVESGERMDYSPATVDNRREIVEKNASKTSKNRKD